MDESEELNEQQRSSRTRTDHEDPQPRLTDQVMLLPSRQVLPQQDVHKRNAISGVVLASDLGQAGIQLPILHQVVSLPIKCGMQSWSFYELSTVFEQDQLKIDLYCSSKDREAVKSYGNTAQKAQTIKSFGFSYDLADKVHNLLTEAGLNKQDVVSVIQSDKEDRFNKEILGKSFANRVNREIRDQQICEAYFLGKRRMHDIAKEFGLTKATVSTITTNHCDPNFAGAQKRSEVRPSPPKLDQIRRCLEDRYRNVGFVGLNFEEAHKFLLQVFPELQTYSKQKILRILREILGIKIMRVKPTPARLPLSQIAEMLTGYFAVLAELMSREVTILCVDETGFFSDNFKRSALGVRGMHPVKKKRAAVLGLHMVACLSQHGLHTVELRRKNFTALEFKNFLVQTLALLSKQPQIDLTRVVLLQDNSPIHRSKEMEQFYRDYRLRTIFTLPATPLSNPVEGLFSDLKAPVRTSWTLDFSQLLARVSDRLKELSTRPGLSYFRRCYRESCATNGDKHVQFSRNLE